MKVQVGIHLGQLVLGGLAATFGFLGYSVAAGVAGIWIGVLGACGAYLASVDGGST